MRTRPILAAAAIALVVAACVLLAGRAPLGNDYPGPTCVGCDYAGPPVEALARLDLHGFFSAQPVMGIVSLALRAPAVALAAPHGGRLLLGYQAGVLACLLVTALLALWLAARLLPAAQGPLPRAALVLLVLAGPMTLKSVDWGHPEEPLCAILCALAVVLAGRGRVTLSGVLLGVAFATKQWALLAAGPVLLAAPRGRLRLAVTATALAAGLTLPMLLGDTSRFLAITHAVGVPGGDVTPSNVWWLFSSTAGGGARTIPTWIGGATHQLVLGLGVALPLVYARTVKGRRGARDALLLLALLFLLRTLLDPMSISYHHTAFFVALAVSEAIRRRGLPLVTLVATGLLVATSRLSPAVSPDLLNRLYLSWSVPFAAYLALAAFRPEWLAGIERLLGRRHAAA